MISYATSVSKEINNTQELLPLANQRRSNFYEFRELPTNILTDILESKSYLAISGCLLEEILHREDLADLQKLMFVIANGLAMINWHEKGLRDVELPGRAWSKMLGCSKTQAYKTQSDLEKKGYFKIIRSKNRYNQDNRNVIIPTLPDEVFLKLKKTPNKKDPLTKEEIQISYISNRAEGKLVYLDMAKQYIPINYTKLILICRGKDITSFHKVKWLDMHVLAYKNYIRSEDKKGFGFITSAEDLAARYKCSRKSIYDLIQVLQGHSYLKRTKYWRKGECEYEEKREGGREEGREERRGVRKDKEIWSLSLSMPMKDLAELQALKDRVGYERKPQIEAEVEGKVAAKAGANIINIRQSDPQYPSNRYLLIRDSKVKGIEDLDTRARASLDYRIPTYYERRESNFCYNYSLSYGPTISTGSIISTITNVEVTNCKNQKSSNIPKSDPRDQEKTEIGALQVEGGVEGGKEGKRVKNIKLQLHQKAQQRVEASPEVSAPSKVVPKSPMASGEVKSVSTAYSKEAQAVLSAKPKNRKFKKYKATEGQEKIIMRSALDVSTEEARALCLASGKDYSTNFINQLLEKFRKTKSDLEFKNREIFLRYFAKVLCYEQRDPMKVNNESFRLKCNIGQVELKSLLVEGEGIRGKVIEVSEVEVEKYLEGVESDKSNGSENHFRRKIAARCAPEQAYSLLTSIIDIEAVIVEDEEQKEQEGDVEIEQEVRVEQEIEEEQGAEAASEEEQEKRQLREGLEDPEERSRMEQYWKSLEQHPHQKLYQASASEAEALDGTAMANESANEGLALGEEDNQNQDQALDQSYRSLLLVAVALEQARTGCREVVIRVGRQIVVDQALQEALLQEAKAVYGSTVEQVKIVYQAQDKNKDKDEHKSSATTPTSNTASTAEPAELEEYVIDQSTIWGKIRARLLGGWDTPTVGKNLDKFWFSKLNPTIEEREGKLLIRSTDLFRANWINNNYSRAIEEVCKSLGYKVSSDPITIER